MDIGIDHAHHVAHLAFFGKPFAVVDAKHLHAFVILKIRKEFGSDQEVLSAVGLAGDFDHRVVYVAFGTLVHTLQFSGLALSHASMFSVSKRTWLISSTRENGARASSVRLMRYRMVVKERS